MKIRRDAMRETAGVFECTVSVHPDSLAAWLALLPTPGAAVDIQMEFGPRPEPRPAPAAPLELVAPVDSPVDPPRPVDERTQFVAPSGLDIARIGGGRSLPKEVLVFMLLIRDPLFQDWVLRETKEPHNAVPDAVDFAARYVAAQVGAPTIFEITPEHFAALAALQDRYARFLETRGLASQPAAA